MVIFYVLHMVLAAMFVYVLVYVYYVSFDCCFWAPTVLILSSILKFLIIRNIISDLWKLMNAPADHKVSPSLHCSFGDNL